jgi:uncharacterized protein with beta-barrel porin domain
MKNKETNDLTSASVDSLKNSKSKLPNYLVIGAVSVASSFAALNVANAADGDTGGTEVAANSNTTATVAAGIKHTGNAQAGFAVTSADSITLGANGDDDAFTLDSNDDEQITATIAGAGVVIFAGDIHVDGADDDLDIVITNTGTVFIQNDIIEDDASTVDIKIGVASNTTAHTLVIDNKTDQNQTLMSVDNIIGVDSDDTTIVAFRSSGTSTADNTTSFTGVLGGSSNAVISQIKVGDVDGQDVLVDYGGTAVTVGSVVLGNGGATADTVKLTVDADGNADLVVAGTINGNTVDTTNLAIGGDDGNSTTFSSDIGVTAALTNVTMGIEDAVDTTNIFNGSLKASTITVGNTTATNNDVYVLSFINAAAETVAGVISEAAALDTTTINISEAAGDNAAALAVTFSNTVALDTFQIGAANAGGNAIFSDTVTATGIITVDGGDNSNEISKIDFGSDVNAELNLDKNTADAVVTYSGAAATTHTGVIHAVSADDGKIIVSNTVGTTFASTVGTGGAIGEIEVSATGIATFDTLIDTALLDLAGTMTVNENASTTDDIRMAATAVLHIEKTVTNGEVVFDLSNNLDDGNINTAAKIFMPVNLKDGQNLMLFEEVTDAQTALIVADIQTVIQDTVLIDYVPSAVSDDIVVTARAKTATTIGSELGVDVNTAKGLSQAYLAAISDTNVDDGLEEIFKTVLQDGTSKELAKQLAPQTDSIGGSTVAMRAMTGTVQGIVSNRMASLRSGDAYVTGMSAGNGMSANSGFIQAFGSEGEQKNTSSSGATVFGFDSETSGLALGFDGMTDDGSTIGLSASYSTTDVDGKGTGKSKNSIDSYTVSVYADKATEGGYIEGSLTYGINDNTASRLINVSDVNRSYSANYDSNQLSLKVGGGVPNEVRDSTFVTPFANATYSLINTDAYTEKSNVANDNLRLKVEQDDINSLVGTIGIKAHMVTDAGTPMISLAVNNEFGDSQIATQNTYQGGGTKFKTTTEVEELSATLGLGYTFGNDVTSLNINYEANANDDEYVNHYGSVKIVAKF